MMYESTLAICTTVLAFGTAWGIFKTFQAVLKTPMLLSEVIPYAAACITLGYFSYAFMLMLPFPYP